MERTSFFGLDCVRHITKKIPPLSRQDFRLFIGLTNNSKNNRLRLISWHSAYTSWRTFVTSHFTLLCSCYFNRGLICCLKKLGRLTQFPFGILQVVCDFLATLSFLIVVSQSVIFVEKPLFECSVFLSYSHIVNIQCKIMRFSEANGYLSPCWLSMIVYCLACCLTHCLSFSFQHYKDTHLERNHKIYFTFFTNACQFRPGFYIGI